MLICLWIREFWRIVSYNFFYLQWLYRHAICLMWLLWFGMLFLVGMLLLLACCSFDFSFFAMLCLIYSNYIAFREIFLLLFVWYIFVVLRVCIYYLHSTNMELTAKRLTGEVHWMRVLPLEFEFAVTFLITLACFVGLSFPFLHMGSYKATIKLSYDTCD